MPLIPNLGCDEREAPDACAALFDMGDAILAAGMDALAPFDQDGGCGCALEGYVSLGEPTPGRCDVLGVHLTNYQAVAPESGNPSSRSTFAFVANWKIDLYEGCYPTDEGRSQPEGIGLELLHEWSRHAYAHGLALHMALMGLRRNTPFSTCGQFDLGPLTPIPPSGLCAGWSVTLTAEVPVT